MGMMKSARLRFCRLKCWNNLDNPNLPLYITLMNKKYPTHREWFQSETVSISGNNKQRFDAICNIFGMKAFQPQSHEWSHYVGYQDGDICGEDKPYQYHFNSLEEFLATPLPDADVTFRLNNFYEAKISGDKVIVGCQTFQAAKILELAQMIVEQQKNA